MEKIKFFFGLILLVITGGRIVTKACEGPVTKARRERFEENRRIQAELDREHGRGWGLRYIDGKRVNYNPF